MTNEPLILNSPFVPCGDNKQTLRSFCATVNVLDERR